MNVYVITIKAKEAINLRGSEKKAGWIGVRKGREGNVIKS